MTGKLLSVSETTRVCKSFKNYMEFKDRSSISNENLTLN